VSWGYALHRLKAVDILGKRNWFSALSCAAITRFRLLVFSCLLVCSQHVVAAQLVDNDSAGKLVRYLVQEKANLTAANNNIKSSLRHQPAEQANLTLRKNQNKAMSALVLAKIDSLESFLTSQHKQQQSIASRIKYLQQSTEKSEGNETQEQMRKLNTLNELNHKTIELLVENLSLARRYHVGLLDESRQLEIWQAKIDERRRLEELHKRIMVLEEARGKLYQKNVELQQEKKLNEGFDTTFNKEEKLLLNNQAIILIQYRINELELQKKLITAEYLLVRNQDVKTLQSVTETYKNAINQLALMLPPLKKMIASLKTEQASLPNSVLKQQFLSIQKTASLRLQQITTQQKMLQASLENKQQQLKKQLSLRQSLVEYHLDSWPSIISQLYLAPIKFYNYIKSLVIKVCDHYIWKDYWHVAFYWLCMSIIILIAVALSQLLRIAIQDKERSRLSAHLYDGILVLLYKNMPYLALLTAIIATFFLNHIPFANYELIVNLLLVWLIFRTLIQIARLSLLERLSDSSGQDVKLYYRLKWLLLAGGWTTALMVLSQQLPLSILLQDIFSRLFMLFLLAVSLVFWKSRDVIPSLLRPVLISKKRYFQNAISSLTILVPLILLTTAIIGLVGYINLAWTMSRYQAYLVLLITAYILARGLIFDLMGLLSEWMISSLQNGWLWIEVILKPLDKILRALLFLTSIIILFQLFGWYADSFVMDNLHQFGRYPLIDVSGIHITLISILKFFILVCIFIWMSKWTREFCYRWLYRNAKDVGVRNSLSVFTQYAVILLGSFITLRVLGLDFSGMSMILGGLAVGMGFGLRDFASNIVGGIMLLIERPVREGDLITLGEYEGRVAHIGIRSMRVSSWDNMEVLIPNAETFNKPFTNWTHQDSVVRTVVPIKVSRADDPGKVQALLQDVLAIIPEILSNPPTQVLLKKIDDALIEFEIRYFINVQIYTRFEIRSKVLFAIMAQFKAAGIKPPIPPLQVELKEGEQDDGTIKTAIEE